VAGHLLDGEVFFVVGGSGESGRPTGCGEGEDEGPHSPCLKSGEHHDVVPGPEPLSGAEAEARPVGVSDGGGEWETGSSPRSSLRQHHWRWCRSAQEEAVRRRLPVLLFWSSGSCEGR
jgi:hypothetical protein